MRKTKTVKKTLAFALAIASLVCLLVLSASAYSGTAYGSTGIYYSISNGEAVIVDAKSYIETADIPESINGYRVTRIEGFAFKDCASLSSVTIPNSVTSIGSSAFLGCTSLSGVTIPSGVTSIGDYAFKDCSGLTEINWYAENVKDFSPYNVVFSNAGTAGDGIDIAFGDGVKSIPAYLFYGIGSNPYKTPKIKTITLGNGVTSIGISAFRNCTLVSSIVIPNGVTSIGSSAFNGCASLSSVTIPDGVTSIGHYTFMDCDKLKSITIPSSVKSVGKQAFYIDSVDLYISDLAAWCNIEFKGVVSTSKYKLYLNGNRITNLVIPDGVTSVGDYAFGNCDGLTKITIPNGVTSIGQSAFVGCPFAEIKIGKDLKSIGNNAFGGVTAVPELYYAGSEEAWSKISLDSKNDFIRQANMHYNADVTHKHSNTEVINKEATCTADGAKTLTCDCGNSYIAVIPAPGHTEVIEAAVPATCTEKGKTEGKHCSVCGEVLVKQTEIPAKGHTEVTDAAVPATCTKGGKTAGSHCSVCGKVLVAQKATKALGHKNKTTLTKATTSKDGKIVTSCTVCKTVSKTTVISRASSVKLAKTSYTYNGKVQKPKVTVKDSKGKLLTEGKDYTVKYQSGRKNPGKYTVTVTFKGNYNGKKTLTFTIAPKAPTLKASAAKKSAKLSWNKKTGASGYTVYMATSKNGKYKKIATVKGNRNVKFTKTGLTKGKTYYFKVAAYTTSGGKTIPGAYSKVKSVKVK